MYLPCESKICGALNRHCTYLMRRELDTAGSPTTRH